MENIASEITIEDNGVAIFTISATGRIVGVAQQTLSRAFDCHSKTPSKLAQKLIDEEFQPTAFSDYGVPDAALEIIADHYAFDAGKRCTEEAKQSIRVFARVGIRSWAQKIKGWIEKPSTPQTYLEALKALVAAEEEKQFLLEQQEKLKEKNALQEIELNILEQDNHVLAQELDDLFDYSSIIRIAKYNKVDEKKFKWRTLKAAARKLGLEVKKVPCPRYVTKNLYPHAAWKMAYPDVALPEAQTIVVKAVHNKEAA